MGIRFRKSIKVAPGVKLNVGKKSVGVSVGGKHGGVSVNSRTGAQARVSAPGTGLSYTTKIGSAPAKTPNAKGKKRTKTKNYYQKLSIAGLICGIVGLLLSCIMIGILPATIGLVLSAICLIQKSGNKKMSIIGLSSSLASVLIFIIVMSAPNTSPSNTDKLISSSPGSSGNTDASSLLVAATSTPAPTMEPTPTPMPTVAPTQKPITTSSPVPTAIPTPQPTETPSGSTLAENSTSNAGNSTIVWVDDTSKRYHKKNGCGMDNAYQVTLEEAINMGKTPCGRCYK